MKLKLIDLKGNDLGAFEADPAIFEKEQNTEAVYQTLRWFLASKRSGTHSTLTRSEVSGGGKKPWKQKGTGRARAGSIRSPLWRHGAVIFGPKPRDYSFNLPRKIKKLALKVVFSDKVKANKISAIESFDIDKPKTKILQGIIEKLGLSNKKILVICENPSENIILASRNLFKVKILQPSQINIYELLNAEYILIVKTTMDKLKEMLL